MVILVIIDLKCLDFASIRDCGDMMLFRAVNPNNRVRTDVIVQTANAVLAAGGAVIVCDTLAPDPADGLGATSAKFFTDLLPPGSRHVVMLRLPKMPSAVEGFSTAEVDYEQINPETIAAELARAAMYGIDILPEDHPIRQIFKAARARYLAVPVPA